MTHNATSGVAHFAAEDDRDCLALIRELLGYCPSNNLDDPPRRAATDSVDRDDPTLDGIVPAAPNQPYDMLDVIHAVVDARCFPGSPSAFRQEHHRRFRAGSTGVPSASWPISRLCLPARSTSTRRSKGAVRALLRCVQYPTCHLRRRAGFLPGTAQEYGGIIKHGAKLLFAFAEATVPKVTVITRKAYGGAYCVMSSKHIRTDFNFAWPTAELAVMGPEGAVSILYSAKSKRQQIPRVPEPRRWRSFGRSLPTLILRRREALSTRSSARVKRDAG